MVDDPPFYALIMAAMTKADTDNLLKLQHAFPDVWVELQARYNAVRGILASDGDVDTAQLDKQLRAMGLR